ncbi:MAG: hypothetical protein BMS9Abin20_1120 [Acidimicrobiia bacterium]|nr:MAG: hypothetical protein BMS9Abin20_1120 [Acidimicrobiia bacterium]
MADTKAYILDSRPRVVDRSVSFPVNSVLLVLAQRKGGLSLRPRPQST